MGKTVNLQVIKRLFWRTVLAICLAFLYGCPAPVIPYVITNETASILDISLKAIQGGSREQYCNSYRPRVVATSNLKNRETFWKNLSEVKLSEFSCNPEDKVIQLSLQPDIAVLIPSPYRSMPHIPEREYPPTFPTETFPIEKITLRSQYGAITYEGSQVTRDFESKGFVKVLKYE